MENAQVLLSQFEIPISPTQIMNVKPIIVKINRSNDLCFVNDFVFFFNFLVLLLSAYRLKKGLQMHNMISRPLTLGLVHKEIHKSWVIVNFHK